MFKEIGIRVASAYPQEGGQTRSTDEQVRLLAKLLRPAHGTNKARQLAVALIERFGSLPSVISAAPERLKELAGVGLATVRLLETTFDVAQRLARERVDDNRPVFSSLPQLQDYLHLMMAHLPVEQVRVLFLDKRNRLIADEIMQTGTVDHTPVYPREIIKRSLELSATAVILVHNHPSGDPAPSSADIRMTNEIQAVGKQLGILVHDHLVIGKFGCASLRTLGLL